MNQNKLDENLAKAEFKNSHGELKQELEEASKLLKEKTEKVKEPSLFDAGFLNSLTRKTTELKELLRLWTPR